MGTDYPRTASVSIFNRWTPSLARAYQVTYSKSRAFSATQSGGLFTFLGIRVGMSCAFFMKVHERVVPKGSDHAKGSSLTGTRSFYPTDWLQSGSERGWNSTALLYHRGASVTVVGGFRRGIAQLKVGNFFSGTPWIRTQKLPQYSRVNAQSGGRAGGGESGQAGGSSRGGPSRPNLTKLRATGCRLACLPKVER